MFIIFGWVKEAKQASHVVDNYCYHCQRKRTWNLWRETEWVSFFAVKTIPFLWKNFIVCGGCNDTIRLSESHYRQLADGAPANEVAAFLEEQQLSQKNELQRNYLRSIRAQGERRDQ
ncbi:MAG TPA: hypothetical protein VIU93_07540 [Gallionellaceae bacterium]